MNINFTLFAQAIVFALFIWVTVRWVWPMMAEKIEERQATIASGLAAADKGSRSLEDAKVQIAGMMDDARTQARQILDQAGGRATAIVEEARTDATKEKERILTAAQEEVAQQVNRARDELRAQVASIAVAGAEKILAREIDQKTHRDLLNQLAAQI
jgi:F-type H+-transporting ATPase subunit b